MIFLLTLWESSSHVMSWIRFTRYHHTNEQAAAAGNEKKSHVQTVLYFDRLTTNISPETEQFNTNDNSSGKKKLCATWFCLHFLVSRLLFRGWVFSSWEYHGFFFEIIKTLILFRWCRICCLFECFIIR